MEKKLEKAIDLAYTTLPYTRTRAIVQSRRQLCGAYSINSSLLAADYCIAVSQFSCSASCISSPEASAPVVLHVFFVTATSCITTVQLGSDATRHKLPFWKSSVKVAQIWHTASLLSF